MINEDAEGRLWNWLGIHYFKHIVQFFSTVTFSGDAHFTANIETSGAIYFGDPDTNGTWRITPSGVNLLIELREAGAYVTKETFTP